MSALVRLRESDSAGGCLLRNLQTLPNGPATFVRNRRAEDYSIASLFLPISAIRRGPRRCPSSSNHIGEVMDEAHRGTASSSGRRHRSTSART